MKLKRIGLAVAVVLAAINWSGDARADTVKIGIIAPFSGRDAGYGKQFREAIDVYVAQHGDTIDGHKIELIYKDSGGPNPAAVKALAQELIVKDKVSYLGGFNFTPNAMAVAPLIEQAHIPTVLFTAATSSVLKASSYFVRTSYTQWQLAVPLARWAYSDGVRKVVILVADFAPGLDAEGAFKDAFTKAGGSIVDTIRMPLETTDFGPYMQKAKNMAPDAIYVFSIVGPGNYGVIKAYKENGLAEAGIRFLGTAETDESNLQQLGDAALGLKTMQHYSAAHDSALNREFISTLKKMFPGSEPNFCAVGAYDGIHVLYQMVKAAGAKGGKEAVDAVRGMAWESPRGPVHLDPEQRHIVQNVYVREVVKGPDGRLYNKEIQTIAAQPDYGY